MNQYIDETYCSAANGTMYNASFNENDCTRFLWCATSVTAATGLLDPPGADGKCSSPKLSVFEWIPARWIEPTFALVTWTERSMIVANGWNKTINFPILQGAVNVADQLSLVEATQNQVRDRKKYHSIYPTISTPF